MEILRPEVDLLIDFRDLRIIGRERSINGTVSLLEDLDTKIHQMSIDFHNDPNNNRQWKEMLFGVPVMDICHVTRLFIGKYGKSTIQLGVNTNLPLDGKTCPLPKGSYFVKNLLVNTDSWPDIIPYGALKANFRYYKNYKFAGGISFILDIEKKH
ncbi:uncharacterized protein LOC6560318 [Drosophila grimshawi]|uniref:GH21867 n=1 Tax=Drosophila grimshawi TaxID=7222 RepID=B4J7Q4_DROGR|nr:uncharacterized protein LOC6560318 [Drosophila grimshawi]EDW02202.1 GH21867 [Drosophila grimshawi]